MPQAGSLSPQITTENTGTLRHCATAPSLRFNINRYANLDADSPLISGSPPNYPTAPMKFIPAPSKYGQLSGVTMSQINLSSTPNKGGSSSVDSAPAGMNKPMFSVGPRDEHHDSDFQSSGSSWSKKDIPSTVVHPCDSPMGTPRGTPSPSPSLLRKSMTCIPEQQQAKSGGGFFGWLTRPSRTSQVEEGSFFHQKEDMKSLQGLTAKARLLKPRAHSSNVSMSDVNVFTPTEY